MDANGLNPTRLMFWAANESAPQWSPDGRKILFVADPGGHVVGGEVGERHSHHLGLRAVDEVPQDPPAAAEALLVMALAALGAGNGSVFQLLPQRFGKELGIMTGLVGAGGGLGAFIVATSLGWSKGQTGSYATGLTVFAGLCVVALVGLTLVKKRWRTTWGQLTTARV